MKLIRLIFVFCLLTVGSLEALADEQIASDNPKRITMVMHEYRFEPAQIALKVGEEVELTLINDGKVMHEFIAGALQTLPVDVEINGIVAETLGVAELEIPPKSSAVLRFTPKTPGEFLIACRAKLPKDHYQEGMRGRLLVR
jgi:uncharacterized cupredoxin-like copper-binding protein